MKISRKWLEDFLFPAVSDRWLAILRVGLGVQIVVYCFSVYGEWHNLFALTDGGWINRDLTEAILTSNARFVPRIGWLVTAGSHLGLSEGIVLTTTWSCLLVAGCCLIAGFFCRTAAIVAWFLYVCAAKSGNLFVYGVDHFTIAGLFYLMIAPHPDRYTLDRKIWDSPIKDPELHGFFRRVLQLHLCVIYFSGGIAKCLGSGWWNGESMWRSLTRPPFNIIPDHVILAAYPALQIMGIAVLVLETGYSIFIWPHRTRLVWLIGIVGMHIGIGVTMGMYLFALIMITLNLAAFGPEFIFRDRVCDDCRPDTPNNSSDQAVLSDA